MLGYEDDEELVRLLAIRARNLVETEQVPLDDIVVLTPSGAAKSRLEHGSGCDGFSSQVGRSRARCWPRVSTASRVWSARW